MEIERQYNTRENESNDFCKQINIEQVKWWELST